LEGVSLEEESNDGVGEVVVVCLDHSTRIIKITIPVGSPTTFV